jgi:hypothetical protein
MEFDPIIPIFVGNPRRTQLTKEEKFEIIQQIGQDRVRNICSICHNKMDIKNYHIQLCKSCRKVGFAFMQIEVNNCFKEVKLYKRQKKSKIIEFLKDPASSLRQNSANAGAI